jgi:hypothetical protein
MNQLLDKRGNRPERHEMFHSLSHFLLGTSGPESTVRMVTQPTCQIVFAIMEHARRRAPV